MLLTVGHGRLGSEELAALLDGAGIDLLVDIRRFPGSRANSAAARGAVPDLTRALGLDYRWEEDLGVVAPSPPTTNVLLPTRGGGSRHFARTAGGHAPPRSVAH